MADAEIFALNANLHRIETAIDLYSSLQWDTCYNDVGTFELHLPIQFLPLINKAFAIENTADSKHCGVIEYIEKETADDGSESFMVKGRMLESILDRRIVYGEKQFYETQPMQIVGNLITDNVISPVNADRIIPNFHLGDLVDSDTGAVDYGCSNANLLDEVQSLCKSSEIGFRLYPDDSGMKFETYKGQNFTEEANTTTQVTYIPITNILQNGRFDNQLEGWTVTRYGITAESYGNGYRLKKTKEWDKYWKERTGGGGYWVYFPLYSGYVSQSVNLSAEHMYYLAIETDNPTNTVLSSGLEIDGGYQLSTSQTDRSVRQSLIFVPSTSGAKNCVLSMGDFPDEESSRGVSSYAYSAILVDLTATFGAGYEPTQEYCDRVIQYNAQGVLQYRNEVIVPIPNTNNPLVFSRDRDNISTLEYSKNTTNEVTTLTVQGEGSISVVLQSSQATGIYRKEAFLDASSEIPREINGTEIPAQSYENMLRLKGESLLESLVLNEVMSADLYILGNCQYGEDFNVGDIVIFTDTTLDVSMNLRITKVTQVWDTNGYKISIQLGEPSPDLYDTITYVAKKLK